RGSGLGTRGSGLGAQGSGLGARGSGLGAPDPGRGGLGSRVAVGGAFRGAPPVFLLGECDRGVGSVRTGNTLGQGLDDLSTSGAPCSSPYQGSRTGGGRSGLRTTENGPSVRAALAQRGFTSRPGNGYSTPAASGTPSAL